MLIPAALLTGNGWEIASIVITIIGAIIPFGLGIYIIVDFKRTRILERNYVIILSILFFLWSFGEVLLCLMFILFQH